MHITDATPQPDGIAIDPTMTCTACREEFGPDEECQNCGAREGETDVDRQIRSLEESNEALEQQLDELREAIRAADRQRCEVESFEDSDEEVNALNALIHDLAALVD